MKVTGSLTAKDKKMYLIPQAVASCCMKLLSVFEERRRQGGACGRMIMVIWVLEVVLEEQDLFFNILGIEPRDFTLS